jgi:protein ImuB
MKRVACIWFPNWSVQRRYAAQPSDRHRAVVLYALGSGGKTQVVACSRDARRRGATPGMLLAEAQSLWPASAGEAVRFEQHDAFADRQGLRDLAVWCQQFSPTVAVDDIEPPDCLLLDATGCGYGPSGEEEFAKKAVASLERRGYWAIAVIADTIGAAWAMAHYGKCNSRVLIIPSGKHTDVLRPLPVEALRLPGDVVQTLHDLNVFRIDELLALPRTGLPSRFGPELLSGIDRALGTVLEVLAPEPPAEPLEASWLFESPVADARTLIAVIEHLLERLLKQLERKHLGVRQLLCSLKPAKCDAILFPIELLRPSVSQRSLMELVRLQVERLRITAEVEAATLRVALAAPLEFQQEEMFGGAEELNRRKEVTRLLERLSSRLGERSVLRPRLRADAQPEFAHQYEPWLSAAAHEAQRSPSSKNRPLSDSPSRCGEGAERGMQGAARPSSLKSCPLMIDVLALFPGGSPQRFQWDGRNYLVAQSWGPERIETGWWREADVRRDYYVVETAAGERFWVFRNLADGSWFLHGVFT